MKDYFKQAKVLAQINQGDEKAFLEVYDFYAPKLFRHVSYRLSSREAAEDITQQVFCKVWQYLAGEGNKIDNLNAFLYRTTNNLLTDYYRRSDRRNISLDDKLGNDLENKLSFKPLYSDKIDHDLTATRVKESLEQLKEPQKELITWRYFDDLSISEISKISGKSQNSVYVGIHRAIKDLEKILV